SVGLLWHERPFQAGRKTRAATPAQTRRLHLVDDPVAAFFDDALGAVPRTARARAFQPPIMQAVEILEDAVFILKHRGDLYFFVLLPLRPLPLASSAGGVGIGDSC